MPDKSPLHKPTSRLLVGLQGIELGAAAHNPFGVDAINIAPCRPFDEMFDNEQMKRCGEIVPVDLVGTANEIPRADRSADFVLSSHVLQWVPDLFGALREFDRVVCRDGYIVIIFPQPWAFPADRRPETTRTWLWRAFLDGWTWDTAPEGYAFGGSEGIYWKMRIERFKSAVKGLYRPTKDWPGLRWRLVDEEATDSKVRNGWYVAYRKR